MGTRQTGRRYRWKYDPILRYRMGTALSEGQVSAFIRRVQCPVLFVHGAESDFMTSAGGRRAQQLPNARILAVEGAGHHIPHQKPEELAEIISCFLSGRDRAGDGSPVDRRGLLSESRAEAFKHVNGAIG